MLRPPPDSGQGRALPSHPQGELLSRYQDWSTIAQAQTRFDDYREDYNGKRPHEALDYDVPGARYQPSQRSLPSKPPEPEYEVEDEKRRVQDKGYISFKGRKVPVSQAFAGKTVALRASEDGVWEVYYHQQQVGRVDLRSPPVSSNV